MSIYNRFSRAVSAMCHDTHKGLGHADLDDQGDGTFAATIFVLVDSQGRYVADADRENLGDEYAYQVGAPDLGEPLQIVELRVRLPLAKAVVVETGSVLG